MKAIFFVQKIAGNWIVKTILSTLKEITEDNTYYYIGDKKYGKVFKDFGWVSSDSITDKKMLKDIKTYTNEFVVNVNTIIKEHTDVLKEVFEKPYAILEFIDGEPVSVLYTNTNIVPDHNTYLIGNINYSKIEFNSESPFNGWIRRKDLTKIENLDKRTKLRDLEISACSELNSLIQNLSLSNKEDNDGTVYANNLLYTLIPNSNLKR